MSKLVLNHLEFRRTILNVRGEFNTESAEKKLYLRESRTKQVIPLDNIKVENGEFEVDIYTLACNNDAPLETGHWYICYKEGDKYRPAKVTDELYDRIYQYETSEENLDVMIDKGMNNYFHVYSKLREKDFAFYLKVEYQLPEKETNVLKIWVHDLKKRHKARISVIRKGIFIYVFKFFNKTVKKTGNKILFTSDSRAEIGGNEAFIYNRMLERGFDKKYVFRFSFKENIKEYRSLKDKILFTYYLATSDYIFVDDYQPEIYMNHYDKEVKIIQVWHACGAFKTVGFERLEMKGSPAFNTRIHKCYTHVPVSSEHVVGHYAEAFAISKSKIYPAGIPRTDVFFDEEYKENVKASIYQEFPRIKEARKVILYAPTFRGINAKTAYFPMHLLHIKKIGSYLKEVNGVMIVKMHPFVKQKLEIPEEYKNYFIDASEYREVNDLLFVTDLLITDYSSVIYEMSLLKKPMLFYAFDLKQYVAERGFYEPFEDIVPGKIVRTLPALLKALEEEDYEEYKLDGFIEKNFKYTDGKSTDRVIDSVFGSEVDLA